MTYFFPTFDVGWKKWLQPVDGRLFHVHLFQMLLKNLLSLLHARLNLFYNRVQLKKNVMVEIKKMAPWKLRDV